MRSLIADSSSECCSCCLEFFDLLLMQHGDSYRQQTLRAMCCSKGHTTSGRIIFSRMHPVVDILNGGLIPRFPARSYLRCLYAYHIHSWRSTRKARVQRFSQVDCLLVPESFHHCSRVQGCYKIKKASKSVHSLSSCCNKATPVDSTGE